MLFRYCILFVFLFFISDCTKRTPIDDYLDAIATYNDYLNKMDDFYITQNGGKTYSDNIAVVNRYYSLILRCNKFTKKMSVNVPKWKELIKSKGLKFYIPDAFEKSLKEYDEINVEINRRLSIIIPRIKTSYLKKKDRELRKSGDTTYDSIAKFRAGGEDLSQKPMFYERNVYPEKTLVHLVHRRYFR